ncbi:uncharacterized protein BO96DRAFT_323904 [Aspergillus niger CBS 101883]|uniref:uncharacterized protein n=1 Tax=Aspergillus lacticoffeatus (strain CBS 101883) TaxID=1450533 RepID=UPI000D8059B3|nr:uncharacterized protein BO96DRAFT_323904 [Aspergillus niger CBS 101883]PYH61736.1 hypothetical protein BO96DRAFT_323904 [Aspergillus niger CBS 101883]
MLRCTDYYLLPIPSNSQISCNEKGVREAAVPRFVTPDTTNETSRTLLAPCSAVTYQIPMLQNHRSTGGRIPIVDANVLASEVEQAQLRMCRSGPKIQSEWARGGSPRTVGSIRDISRSTQTSALIADQWKEGMSQVGPLQDWLRCQSEKSKYRCCWVKKAKCVGLGPS